VVLEKDGMDQLDQWCKNEVLHGVKGAGNTLCTVNRRKDNWIGHILHRNSLPEHITKGKIEERIEVIGRQGIRHKQTLDTTRKQEDSGN